MTTAKGPSVPFNRPYCGADEVSLVNEALSNHKIGPGGPFSKACQTWLTERLGAKLVVPTASCTAALEIAAMLLDLAPGDEVIMPSFGYPSTANAFVRAGATPVFVDIDPVSMNLDPGAVAAAITPRSRAIVPIHYGGMPADMDPLLDIAQAHGLDIVEDAANAFLSTYKGRACATMGRLGCLSFHETKALHCGQGGALVINQPEDVARAEILLEKGTDRREFIRGEVDRYTWRDIGSAFALDDIRAAFLLAQLRNSADIIAARIALWHRYQEALAPLVEAGHIDVPQAPDDATFNGVIFWIKLANRAMRDAVITALAEAGIHSVFHYIPLHSAQAGQRYGRFAGPDRYTTSEADRLLRLPMFFGLSDIEDVTQPIFQFFQDRDP